MSQLRGTRKPTSRTHNYAFLSRSCPVHPLFPPYSRLQCHYCPFAALEMMFVDVLSHPTPTPVRSPLIFHISLFVTADGPWPGLHESTPTQSATAAPLRRRLASTASRGCPIHASLEIGNSRITIPVGRPELYIYICTLWLIACI